MWITLYVGTLVRTVLCNKVHWQTHMDVRNVYKRVHAKDKIIRSDTEKGHNSLPRTINIMSYDFCVIGSGMIGSSVAKYLSSFGHNVALAGPGEDNNAHAHGAWFDQARITRLFDSNPYWRDLSR